MEAVLPLETSDNIKGLNPAWPLGSDPKSQGDDHLRLIKAVLQKTFPAGFDDKPIGDLIPEFATTAEVVAGKVADKTISPETARAIMPTGAVLHFAGAVAPAGWLFCDGSPVLVANADLRAFLIAQGNPYGVSGADPLLPDLRGEFIRGFDGGRGVDAGRVFGSAQADEFKSHEHPIQGQVVDGSIAGGTTTPSVVAGNRFNQTIARAVGGTETRPRNVALLPCIKT
jgi:microcystin-dependent protein